MRRVQIIGALCLAMASCMVGAVSASAAPTDPFFPAGSFDGSQTPEGSFQAGSLAVNYETGNIILFDQAHSSIVQLDPAGHPVNFSGLGSPVIPVASPGTLTVDNSGGPTQGRIYLASNGEIFGFGADGKPLGAKFPLGRPDDEGLGAGLCQVAVAADGHFWAIEGNFAFLTFYVREYESDGTPIGGAISVGQRGSCAGAFDELGNFYRGNQKFDAGAGFAPLGSTGDEGTLEHPNANQVQIDPSTQDVFLDHGSLISGSRYSDPLVTRAPFETIPGYGGEGFAFDRTGQTMYVSQGENIAILHRQAEPPVLLGRSIFVRVRGSEAFLLGRLFSPGARTALLAEYGPDTGYGNSQPIPGMPIPFSFQPQTYRLKLAGLTPNSTYHLRLVLSNAGGTTYGPDLVLRTASSDADTCTNLLERQQTGSSQLPECRGYELVSAKDTGGYDVESYLVPGQTPFPGFPMAADRVLYATHSGAVPGPWKATNRGPDPYLASRGPDGWRTDYLGLSPEINPATGSFSSVLGEADSSLSTLAFAGPGLCDPCFTNGDLETGIPVRLPSGQLVQGMAGSLSASVPSSAKPEGKLAQYFSADGSKLLFASRYAFELGANDENGSLTVYARDLTAGTTEIVSTDSSGNALTGTISELGVSADGSRVVIGKGISEDPAGNEYVHPYLHIAGRKASIDLAPLASKGVLYAGMTQDGSKVFFTSPDKLTGTDSDESADLYEADVDGSGNLSLKAVTSGSSNACSPVANSDGEHWNTTGPNVDCSAAAISGGGGVASSTGAVYFLSPESFGGQGTLNEPNLYLALPSGAISFVATLEPNNPLVLDSVKANVTRKAGDFQTTPDGAVAAYVSRLLPEEGGLAEVQVYRFEIGHEPVCVSCEPESPGDSSLAPDGSSLTSDGRLFFNSPAALDLGDSNELLDVYEWTGSRAELISSGKSSSPSGLLSVSADGTDAFFFTRDPLAPEEDLNGGRTRIYDARVKGGFFYLPASVPCQASDECHGPSTPVPGPADIKSSGKTTQGNIVVCAKDRVKKRGQCVKKAHAKKHQKKKHAKKRKAAAKKRAAGTNGKRGGRNA